MIEVELKFKLDDESEKRLVDGAEFFKEVSMKDIYFDADDFRLTSKDWWLRSRNDKFELKISMNYGTKNFLDQYDELETEPEIRNAMNLPAKKTFAEDIEDNGYKPFCVCKTTRRKFKRDSFNIDLDIVEFEEFSYKIAEIEMMVNDKSEIQGAVDKIKDFANRQGLVIAPVRGKVVEYLQRQRPDHYEALIKSGAIKHIE